MHRIQCAMLATVALVGLASVATAGPAVPYSWTGFYAGGNIGYSWGRADSTYNEGAFTPHSFSTSESLDGPIGGVQFGYNWQLNSPWVGGFETDFHWSGERGSGAFAGSYILTPPGGFTHPIADTGPASTGPGDPPISGTFNSSIQWVGTVRGRLGVLVTPTTLVYGTGGLAYGEIRSSGTVTDAGCTPACMWSFGQSGVRPGWTLGGGIEGAVPNSSDWTWKVEYLFVDFWSLSGTGFDTDIGKGFNWNTRITDSILLAGFNLRFH
jgi:outer membrane immunogenic protein